MWATIFWELHADYAKLVIILKQIDLETLENSHFNWLPKCICDVLFQSKSLPENNWSIKNTHQKISKINAVLNLPAKLEYYHCCKTMTLKKCHWFLTYLLCFADNLGFWNWNKTGIGNVILLYADIIGKSQPNGTEMDFAASNLIQITQAKLTYPS